MKFQPPIGAPPAVQFIGVERLAVDPSYQRGTQSNRSRKLIAAIAEAWDWRLCTPLLVSSRDKELFIIDGQHRWEAAKVRGDIQYLPCAVADYEGAAAEAALFVAANRSRVQVNPIDMFRAGVASGDEATLTVDRLVREAGLRIASNPGREQLKPGELLCTKSLYTALRVHGADKLAAALAQIAAAFGDQVIIHPSVIFAAVLRFFTQPPPDFDAGVLAEALASQSADEWVSHPRLTGVIGRQRAYTLTTIIYEVTQMLAEDETAQAA